MQRTCSVHRSVIAVVATCVVAGIAAPAPRAQFTYEAYLEPPEGKIFQGMGQWEENDEYLADLDGYLPAAVPYPGHEMIVVNIPPSEHASDRPFDEDAQDDFLLKLQAMETAGRIPQISLSWQDYTPSSQTFYAWTAHDDDFVSGSAPTQEAMENQIERVGAALAEFDKPVFMRIGFEFNNVSVPSQGKEGYDVDFFAGAYNETADILESMGATQIAHVWTWQASAPTDYMDWYPGDEYVDWFGIDTYRINEFTSDLHSPIDPAPNPPWQDNHLDEIEGFLAEAARKDVPVFMETSCVDFEIAESETDDNASWDNWFVHMFDFLEAHPRVVALNYVSHTWTGGSGGPPTWLDGNLANCDEVMNNWVAELQGAQFIGQDSQLLLDGYNGWWGLGNDLAGLGAAPVMTAAGVVRADEHVGVTLTGAMASKPGVLFIGYSELNGAFKGGILVPNPDVALPITTTGSGGHTFTFDWPAVADPGDTIWFQCWVKEQNSPEVWSATNAIKGVTL